MTDQFAAYSSVSEPGGEDFSANTSTAGRVAVDGAATGEIGSSGDRDWFAVELVAGRTYTIDLKGHDTDDGELSDPYLRGIHDADGKRIPDTKDDDGGVLRNSQLTFTATESGTYYIAAGAYSGRGTYTLEVTDNSPPDVNEAPAFDPQGYAFELTENVDGSTTRVPLGTVAATDLEGAALSYSIEGGNESGLFEIDAASGELFYLGAGEDFEVGTGPFELTVRASDGVLSVDTTVTVSVTDDGLTFVYAPGHQDDTISNFAGGEDRIDLTAFSTIAGFSDLTVTSDADGVTLDLSAHGGGTILLQGFDIDDLDASDFVFPIVGTLTSDWIYGDDGRDVIYGGGGNDSVSAGEGDDTVYGGEGNDWLGGDAGSDTLDGGEGDDWLEGDWLEADAGDDTLSGGEGDDVLVGGEGDDTLDGGDGDDLLVGDRRADRTAEVAAPGGDDLLRGGAGDDVINGGSGDDTLYGGDGADVFLFETYDGNDVIGDFVAGEDLIHLGGSFGGTTFEWDESMITADGDDAVFQPGFGNTIRIENVDAADLDETDFLFPLNIDGTSGDDTLHGGEADDDIGGGGGHDVLYGGAGNDRLAGDDRPIPPEVASLLPPRPSDYVWGDDTLSGGAGDDTLYGYKGDDTLYGGEDTDGLHGGEGDDRLFGGEGHDGLYGGDGNDTLIGGLGRDRLEGGAGDDTLYGDEGGDVLLGGDGADTFVITDEGESATKVTVVIDFADGDRIDLTRFPGISGFDDLTIGVSAPYHHGAQVDLREYGGGRISLMYVDPDDLDASHFVFGDANGVAEVDGLEEVTGAVEVNGAVTGELEFRGDRDWFAVEFVAGQTYTINLKDDEDPRPWDTFLYGIHGSDGTLIPDTTDDNGGAGSNSLMGFTALESGTHYIAVGGRSGSTGRYTLEVSDNALAEFSEQSYAFDLLEYADGSTVPVSLGTVSATDPEGEAVSYSLVDGSDSELFEIDSASGELFYTGTGEEIEPGIRPLEVTVQASDGTHAIDTSVTVNIADVNEAPVYWQEGYDFGLAETADGSTTRVLLGRVRASDPDRGWDIDTVSYSLVGGNEAGLFEIEMDSVGNGSLFFTGGGEGFEAGTTSFNLTVRASDGELFDDTVVTVSVAENVSEPDGQDLPEDASTAGTVTVGGAVTGNNVNGDRYDWFAVEFVAGRTYTIDLKGSDTGDGTLDDPKVWGIVDPDGQLDFDSYDHDGNSGEGRNSRVVFTAEQSGTHYIRAGSDSSLDIHGTYTLEVTENALPEAQQQVVPQPPVFSAQGYAFALAENADGSTSRVSLGTVSATDPEGATLSYSLEGGNGSGLFEIDAASGELFYTGAGEDFETGPGSFELTVRASDGDFFTDTSVVVGVADVQEVPAFGQQGYAFDLAENSDGSTTRVSLGTVAAVDPDGTALSYSIEGGNTSGLFEIDAASGELFYTGTGEDFEAGTGPFDLTVRASDGAHAVDTTVTVSVTDVQEDPIGEPAVEQSVSEPGGEDFSASTSTAGRVAVGDSVTGSIGSSGDEDWFAVELVAGVEYRIDLEGGETGVGTLADPLLRWLHGPDGAGIRGTRNNDGGEGDNARQVFTPTESGTYYPRFGSCGRWTAVSRGRFQPAGATRGGGSQG